ncbi:NAD(P)H-dependent oxidoreductase [Microvirga sp. 3-52]|uniref:NADPH-dependent FMN reductase n=1 Tax=Microvirga sp. 3-52 TaxID=2792425 RepID=UPI001AD2BAFA|nr:NAD(P)H-dependent oxidoreductase [Microvirga sp. 3-52]MBO1909241.1 NAD(P)H-dependent oxidoreductase [Microvirga sp. 3-52]MBS7455367.1 NAD(P)H-dependent oxidoreductase [Microvirga sp. 3-52]
MNTPIKVALIYGSTREGRFCDTVANWTANEIWRRNDFSLDLIDPAELDLPPRHGGSDHPALAGFRRRLGDADAFIIVTPEYNHGYPAPLKFLIDSAYREWQAKPVAFVSYGGLSGGLRAVEQLRAVFAELHAVTVRDTVSFANAWSKFDADGHLLEPDEPRKAMATLLAHLRWWAQVLRDARHAAPYGEVAA